MANDTMKILAVLVAAWFIFGQGNMGTQQPAVPTTTGGGSGGSTYIATTGTVITLPVSDATQSGVALTGLTVRASRNGGPFETFTSGTSTASPGEKINFIISNASVHSAVTGELTVPNSPTMSVPVAVYRNASSITIQTYSTTSVAMTTGSTCVKAANQTTLGAGQTYNHRITIQGQDKKSTGDLLCILEASDATATQDMILSGSGATKSSAGTPSTYSTAAGGLIRIYDVPAVIGATTKEFNLQVQSKTGQSLAAADSVKITCLSKDNYVDSLTGKLGYGVEDSAGTSTRLSDYVEIICYS